MIADLDYQKNQLDSSPVGPELAKVENYINRQPFANGLTQGQFDALSSFIFNIGTFN